MIMKPSKSVNVDLFEEKLIVQNNMMNYGGGFVSNLGEALAHADVTNTIIIRDTWPDLWEEYLNFEKLNI